MGFITIRLPPFGHNTFGSLFPSASTKQNAKNFEVLANLGAAYGTAKSGVGIANLGVRKSQRFNDIIANLDVL